MITLQFSTNEQIGSKIIRLATWSEYSHVDFVLPNGDLLGAYANGGVRIVQPQAYTRMRRYQIDAPITVLNRALSQLGKPYDWPGILGIGFRRDWQEDDAWFCSELVAWAFQQEGYPLLRAEHYWRITPRDLLLSQRLEPYAFI